MDPIPSLPLLTRAEGSITQPKTVKAFLVFLTSLTRLEQLPLCDSDRQLAQDSFWSIVFSIGEQLHCVKSQTKWRPNRNNQIERLRSPVVTTTKKYDANEPSYTNLGATRDVSEKNLPEASTSATTRKRTSPGNLPVEILTNIFEFLCQEDLYTATTISRRWSIASQPILYRSPELTTLTAIDRFLLSIEATKSHERNERVKRITFTNVFATNTGSLAARVETGDVTKGCEELLQAHTSLFRMMVIDRSNPVWAAAHPVVIRLVDACRQLNDAKEELYRSPRKLELELEESKRKQRKPGTSSSNRRRPLSSGAGSVGEGSSSQSFDDDEEIEEDIENGSEVTEFASNIRPPQNQGRPPFPTGRGPDLLGAGFEKTLPNMIKFHRHLLDLLRECGGIEQNRFVGVCTLLLEIFDNRNSAMWCCVGTDTIFKAQRLVTEKCRKGLSAFSAAVLIEVQYSKCPATS
jgi:hypothetical protein